MLDLPIISPCTVVMKKRIFARVILRSNFCKEYGSLPVHHTWHGSSSTVPFYNHWSSNYIITQNYTHHNMCKGTIIIGHLYFSSLSDLLTLIDTNCLQTRRHRCLPHSRFYQINSNINRYHSFSSLSVLVITKHRPSISTCKLHSHTPALHTQNTPRCYSFTYQRKTSK